MLVIETTEAVYVQEGSIAGPNQRPVPYLYPVTAYVSVTVCKSMPFDRVLLSQLEPPRGLRELSESGDLSVAGALQDYSTGVTLDITPLPVLGGRSLRP
jgi:hypothetical protein